MRSNPTNNTKKEHKRKRQNPIHFLRHFRTFQSRVLLKRKKGAKVAIAVAERIKKNEEEGKKKGDQKNGGERQRGWSESKNSTKKKVL